jgi:hypothetical protein
MLATEFSSSQTTNMSLGGLGTKLSSAVTFGQPISMSVFYGQSAGVAVTAWTFKSNDGDTWEEVSQACTAMAEEGTTNVTLYHNGLGTNPANGNTIYTNDPGTTTVGTGIYAYSEGRSNFTFITNGSGVVSERTPCE